MENASKALIIAGGVLLSLLVIGTLVFMANQLSDLRQTEEDAQAEERLEEFYRELESYTEDNMRGNEILSLANMLKDYNDRYAGGNIFQYGDEGYDPISLTVTYNLTPMTDSIFFENGMTFDLDQLIEQNKKLEDEVESMAKAKPAGYDKTYRELSGMTYRELYDMIERQGKYTTADTISAEINRLQSGATSNDKNCIEYYNQLVSEQKDIKSSVRFNRPTVERYDNGRIKSLTYVQK